jgi:hypothetical protein
MPKEKRYSMITVKYSYDSLSHTGGHRYGCYQSQSDEQIISERDAEIAEHVRNCEHKVENVR